MTQHDTATDVRPEHVERSQPVDIVSTQPNGVALPGRDAEDTQTLAPATPSPRRRWVRIAAPIAAVAILFGITTGVMVLQSDDDVAETVASSVADVHPADWQLENQARQLDSRKADADRFAGRYSNRDRSDAVQPAIQMNGNDTHLFNQAKKLEDSRGRADADQPRRRPGVME
jgi:hypothetical protein